MLEKFYPHLLYSFPSESDLVKAIGELSEAFTTDRSKIHRYLSDPRLVSAYTAFYLTTNLPKLRAVMSWLTPEWREELLGYELIDIGAGPGTFTLAWHELGGKHSVMFETSELMRAQAKKILENVYQQQAHFSLAEKKQKRLALFGHSMNEMGVDTAITYLKKCDADVVWLIEPGTKEVFKQALEFRERLVKSGWFITYPCLGSSVCPMAGSGDWCHQFVDVRHDPDVERLTQLAQKDRRKLPLTVFMFSRGENYQREENLARIVRKFPDTKFSFEWQVCLSEENALKLERFELPFKQVEKAEQKAVGELLSGALVKFETLKSLKDSRRIKLIRE